jgi:hypothetical protein
MTDDPKLSHRATVFPIPLLRRDALCENLRKLADRFDALTTDSPRSEISDLALDIEATGKWLEGARERVIEYRLTFSPGAQP